MRQIMNIRSKIAMLAAFAAIGVTYVALMVAYTSPGAFA
jgi:hypothetical protein